MAALQKGAKGAKVAQLQKLLNKLVTPKPPLAIDGIFGKKTDTAVKLFQGKSGLKKDGIVGQNTAAALGQAKRTSKVQKGQPECYIRVNGKLVGLTHKQYEERKRKIISGLRRGPVLQMKIAAATVKSEWEHFNELNSDQYIVSTLIEFSRGQKLPPKAIISNADQAYKTVEAALASGDLKKFYGAYAKAEPIVNNSIARMRSYRENMIEGGGNWITGLEFTKTASFTFCAVFAAPAAGAALGTGAVASAMIGGAAVKATETAAGEIGSWSAGKAKWTPGGAIKKTLIDAGIGAVTGFLTKGGGGGKHIVEKLTSKLLPKVAKQAGFKLLSTATLRKVTVFFMTEGAKKALEDAVADLGKAAKADPKMSLEKFLENIAINFVKGAAMGPVGKVIEKFAKNASKSLDAKDRQKIWNLVHAELTKQAKGDDIYLGAIEKRTTELADKYVNDMVAKNFDKILDVVVASWKGPMSPAALEKKLRDKVLEPSNLDPIIARLKKDAKNELAKQQKKKSKR